MSEIYSYFIWLWPLYQIHNSVFKSCSSESDMRARAQTDKWSILIQYHAQPKKYEWHIMSWKHYFLRKEITLKFPAKISNLSIWKATPSLFRLLASDGTRIIIIITIQYKEARGRRKRWASTLSFFFPSFLAWPGLADCYFGIFIAVWKSSQTTEPSERDRHRFSEERNMNLIFSLCIFM